MNITRREAFGLMAAGAAGIFALTGLPSAPFTDENDRFSLQGKPDFVVAPNYLLWRRRENNVHVWTIETMHDGQFFGLTADVVVDDHESWLFGVWPTGESSRRKATIRYMDDTLDAQRLVSPVEVETCEILLDMMNRPIALKHHPLLTTQLLQANADVVQMWPGRMQRFADAQFLGKPRQYTTREWKVRNSVPTLHYYDPFAMYPNLMKLALA
jgi:hypothetical protein